MINKQQLPFVILVLGQMKQSDVDRQGVSGFCCALSDLLVKISNLLLTECLTRLPKLHATASSEVRYSTLTHVAPFAQGPVLDTGTGDTQGQLSQSRFTEGLGSR